MFAARRPPSREASSQPKTSLLNKTLRKRKKDEAHAPCLHLERVLGLSTTTPFGIDVHPKSDVPLVAFPSGGIVTLYNHRKNRQTGFLISASASANPSHNSHVSDEPGFGAGALPQSSNGKKLSAGNAVKPLSCVAFSPDGAFLAAGETGHQPRILIWDYSTSTIVSDLRGHKFGISAITFSPNMKYLVSVGFQHDGFIYIWNWRTGQKLAYSRVSTKLHSVTFDDTGTFFVTAGFRHFKFWYFDTNGLLPKTAKPLQKNQMQALEGKFGIVGDHKNSCFVDTKCHRTENSEVLTYAITEKGILVLFSEERIMEKWVDLKVSRGRCIAIVDKMIVCGCSDGIIRLFEPVTLKYIATIPKPHPVGVDVASSVGSSYKVSSNPDSAFPDAVAVKVDALGEKIVCVYSDQSLFIWDVKDLKHIGKYRSFLYHSDCIWGVEVAPAYLNPVDHPIIDTSDLISPAFSEPPQTPLPPPRGLPPNSFVTFSSDSTIRFWNIDAAHSREGELPPSNNIGSYFRRNIYSRELLKIIYVDDMKTKATHDEIEKDVSTEVGDEVQRGIRSLKISKDGKLLASGDRLGNVRVYELETFSMLKYMEAHDAEVLTMDFSSDVDGLRFLSTGGRDRLIHIFDIKRSFELVQTIDDHSSSITAVRFSHSGRRLMSSAADKSIIFRKLTRYSDTPEFSVYHNAIGRATVFDIDVNPNEEYLATVSQDRRLNIFSIESGKPIRSYRPDPVDDPGQEGGSGGLIKVAIDPSGCFIATCGSDKCIRIFDFATGACIARVVGHSDLITGIKFTHDCSRLISTSADGCILIWKIAHEVAKFMQDRVMTTSEAVVKSVEDDSSVDFSSDYSSRYHDTASGYYSETSEKGSVDSSAIFRPPPSGGFVFGFNEHMLPTWARSAKDIRESMNSNSSQNTVLPTKGRWATRVDNSGVSLFSELADERPVARFDDLFTRRFSIEQAALSRQSSDQQPATDELKKEPLKDDIVVEDLELQRDTAAAETNAEGVSDNYEGDFESDHDVEDVEDTMFVDNAGESDVVDDPSSFVITEEKADEAHVQTSLLKGDADAEGEAMKGTQENSDESNVSTSLLEKTKAAGDASDSIPEIIDAEDDEGRIGKLTLEEYLLQPVDSSSVRQSISAQHLFRRRTVVNEDILAGSGTMPGSRQNPDIIINEEELQLDKIDIDAAESIANDVPTPLSFASSASSPIRVGTGDELELEKEIPHEDGIVEEDIQRNLHQIKTGLRSLQGHMERLEATRPSSSGDSPEAQLLDTLRSSLLEISSLTNEILGLPQSTDADSFNAALEKYSDMLVGMVQRKLQG